MIREFVDVRDGTPGVRDGHLGVSHAAVDLHLVALTQRAILVLVFPALVLFRIHIVDELS